jgi:hypothetical protein
MSLQHLASFILLLITSSFPNPPSLLPTPKRIYCLICSFRSPLYLKMFSILWCTLLCMHLGRNSIMHCVLFHSLFPFFPPSLWSFSLLQQYTKASLPGFFSVFIYINSSRTLTGIRIMCRT